MSPRVAVLMPVYNGAAFIARALESLTAGVFVDWELAIVDDGSTDGTGDVVNQFMSDPRIRCHRLTANHGLGYALNVGLDMTSAPLVAYLPCDDVWYVEHLGSLVALLGERPEASLAYSGVRHHYNRSSCGRVDGFPLQLVQVVHRRTSDRWVERGELVTDDLDRMLWNAMRRHGPEVGSGRVTCEWVDHPDQLHKVIREPVGGINPYRARFSVQSPLRFHSTQGNRIDEVEHYRQFRERPDTQRSADGLKILLAGELAYNAERVLALEERGHALFGLWTPDPYWYNSVGPLPFGHVQDIPLNGWREVVKRIKPDVIYAQLNWQAVPFLHAVMSDNPGVPFIWHFKEGPFICLEKGTWPLLIDLYKHADGAIYTSPEMLDWFDTVVPGLKAESPTLVLDGDLPKQEWFSEDRTALLSDGDGQVHTVVPGRPIGLHPHTVEDLGRHGIHLHFYGDFTHGQWRAWIERARQLAPDHLHLHANVDQSGWVREFSRYDAGWLHAFSSENQGDLRRANWDDLNYPARMATLMSAGVPMIQMENRNSIVATQSLAREMNVGLFYSTVEDLADKLHDRERMAVLRETSWDRRFAFSFDHHADRLVAFFRSAIDRKA